MSNSAYSFTQDDGMNPVFCIGCRQHIPVAVSNAGRGLCPDCLGRLQQTQAAPPVVVPTPQGGPTAPCPPPQGYAPSHQAANKSTAILAGAALGRWAFRPRKVPLAILAGAALVCFVAFAGVAKVVRSVQDDNRRASYAALLAKLQRENPDKRFAVYAETVPINAQLASLRVDRLDMSRDGDRVRTRVTFTGTTGEEIAPEVYVSLYDAKGAMVGRAAVVSHIFADLAPRATDSTEDAVRIGDAEPVIVAVDDDPAKRQQEAVAKQERDARNAQAAIERARESAATAEEERVRGPKPVPSAWDTICPEVNAWMKDNMKDYDSLKIVNGSPVVAYRQDAWCQRLKYRARNSFGGTVLEEKLFVIRDGRVIDVMDY